MVSSFYPVFAAKDLAKEAEGMCAQLDLKVHHHFQDDRLEYYVLVDANGNHADLVKIDAAERLGLYGMRINVDDFDAGVSVLEKKGFKMFVGPVDFPKFIYGVMENPENPHAMRYLVYHHKKG